MVQFKIKTLFKVKISKLIDKLRPHPVTVEEKTWPVSRSTHRHLARSVSIGSLGRRQFTVVLDLVGSQVSAHAS